MTDKADVAALREAALKATHGEWCTDSQHSVIADSGLNANYYVAACSGPDSKINAAFIALANPATILSLLDQLEAESKGADSCAEDCVTWMRRAKAAEAEFAASKGEQVPVAWRHKGKAAITVYQSVADEWVNNGWPVEKLFSAPQKPVVLPKLTVGEVMYLSGYDRQYAEGWVSANDNAIREIEAAGGVVKGGE